MMETKVQQIKLNGLNFEYRETGKLTGSPLIALHALGASAEYWDEVAIALGKNYRVLALDQRGHGGSARPGVYSFELMCEDLRLFADAMGLERFTLIGHSMGGTVSYLFSEKYPSRIVRLVVEDTPPPVLDKQTDIPVQPNEPLPFDWPVVPAILTQLNHPSPEWWERLPTITAPTLIVGGGSTSPIPQEKLREVSELIPNCQLITVEGAGHNVHVSSPQAFLSAILRFL